MIHHSPMKISVGILRWYLLIDYNSLLTLLVFIDEIFLSINIEGITVGIKWIEKNQKVQ
jgi:hypothetical protein